MALSSAARLRPPRAFSLVELLVTILIFVLLILGIGVIFRSTGRTVSTAEAHLQLLANVRAVQDQMARDLASLDPTTFLVIRRPVNKSKNPFLATDECDQIAFIANGTFPYKTPGFDQAPLLDETAHAALIWYGHLAVEGTGSSAGNCYPQADQAAFPMGQDPHDPWNVLPSGRTPDDYILGRHATLLLSNNVGPPPQSSHAIYIGQQRVPAATMPSRFSPPVDVGEGSLANIASSRVGFASVTPNQIMQEIMLSYFLDPKARLRHADLAHPPPIIEASFCYRFKTLLDPWSTEIRANDRPSLTNAAIRMNSVMLQGVPSFQVEVMGQDGQFHEPSGYADADTKEQIAVYTPIDHFSPMPAALRITLRITDPQHRLLGGRTFQQIVKLPS
jgi:type II secretory pathway pseudopilin PulG